MRNFWGLSKAFFLESFRNRFSFFFNILLPMVFFLLFGLVFSESTDYLFAYYSDTDISIKGVRYTNKDLLIKSKNNYHAVAIIENNKVIVFKNSDGYAVDSWINGIKIELERKINNVTQIINVKSEKVDSFFFSNIEYIFTGTLALSIMSIGMFGAINLFSKSRNNGTIRKFKTLPLSPHTFVFSFSFSQFLISFISILLIRAISIFLFSFDIRENLFMILISIVSSSLGMIGFGVILSILFPKTASSVAQFLYTIFIFFSGIYFPIDFLPPFLKSISFFTPVKYVVEMFKYSYGIKEINHGSFLIYSLIMSILGFFLLSFGGKILFFKEE
ncbi:ABC transporter permease [Thermosipho atlanticus]|uniref:Transport permease protein n=1 Tax=Thermosipho atlanticus DSM 15807 TaxID=1123380 RepID=A0A1M5RZE7_9BACT|nr:ABC transporter permease [Thermosipho atlanticus]SHH31732.1 ABC-2 type transport system permease protein [Thermosipho atlanticus DSM 15807]